MIEDEGVGQTGLAGGRREGRHQTDDVDPAPPRGDDRERLTKPLQDAILMEIDSFGELRSLRGQSGRPSLGIGARRPLGEMLRRLSPAFERSVDRCVHDGRGMDQVWWLRGRGARPVLVNAVLDRSVDGGWLLTLSDAASPQGVDEAPEVMYARQERAGLLDRLAGLLAQGAGLKDVMTAWLPPLVQHLAMDAAGFYLVRDGSKAEVVSAYGRTRRRGFPYPKVDVPDLRALLPASTGVVEVPSRRLPPGIDAVTCKGAGQVVLVPAPYRGESLAFLVLSRAAREPLARPDEELLATAARVIGLAARVNELSTQSEQSSAVLQTAYAVSRAISRSLDLQMTFSVIAENVARVVRGSRCLLFENDPQSGDFVAVASSERGDAELVGLRLVLKDGDPVFDGPTQIAVEDLVWGAGVSPALRGRLQAWSALLVPMEAQNEPLGLLLIYAGEENRRYSAGEVTLAQEVAEQAAIAIQNARLYHDLAESRESIQALLTRLARIRESERQRLASIVHDDILQSVVGTVYELQAFRTAVSEEALPRLEETIAVLRAAIDDARRVISDLRPPVLDGKGFAASMRALVDRADKDGPARVGLYFEEVPDIGAAEAAALYKITREALTNARRHAQADRIWVEVRRHDDGEAHCAQLIVRDDGLGTDASLKDEPDHFGLRMIQEQAAVVGGWAAVDSLEGGGVVVQAVVPLGV